MPWPSQASPGAQTSSKAEGRWPKQVWSWDISYLPTNVKGICLYLLIYVWSRKIVAWDVEEKEDPKIAAKPVTRACLSEQISRRRQQPLILHHDEQPRQQHPRQPLLAST